MARLKISISLENFKILNFFKIWALRESIFCDSTLLQIPLFFVLLFAESLAIPGPRLWESCDSRFAILCR